MVIYDIENNVLLDIVVDDTSTRNKVLNGENTLTLNYALAEHKEMPLGAWCVFKGERYSLMSPEDITMNHRRSFEYTLTMHSEDAKAKLYKFINPIDGRLKFSLTAKPVEHLQMFVDNMNKRDSGWTIGECPDHVEIVLSYNHTTCHDALVQLANELELDYWFVGKSVSIGKLELNRDNPLALSYGGDGAGLKPNIKRNNYSEALPVEILYTQGSERNIDASKYGASELHLPKLQGIRYDGEKFEGEEGFDESKARAYIVDENGYSVKRSDKERSTHSEDSLDCTEIYPAKEEEVSEIKEVDAEGHLYDITFASTVDYSKYQIAGEMPRVIFQTGMLAGKEFDLETYTNGKKKDTLKCEEQEDGKWLVGLHPKEEDGITMPDKGSGYMPAAGDKFKVFGIQLPDEYICDNATKSGAEWDMLRYAVKYLYEHEEPQYTITGELDEMYAKRRWDTISDRLVLGSYISFTDKSFQSDPLLIRIVGIKEFVNKPYSPVLEISNASTGGTLAGALNRLENQDAQNEDRYRRSVDFTKRRWRDTRETLAMLASAFDNFSSAINPVTVETMAMLVGDEMLQFIFTESLTSDTQVEFNYSYDAPTGVVSIPKESFIKHMTLGISSISPTHGSSEYKRWSLPPFSQTLEAEKSYYIYAKVSKTSTSGEFVFSETSLKETDEHYYLLVGIMNSEFEAERSFASMYGFTEILPARITTDKVVSSDGNTYFDLKNGEIGGKINFASGSSGLDNVDGWKDMKTKVDATIKGVSVEYAVGSSATEAPTQGWQTTAPVREQGQYLWQRTATTTNGGMTYSEATCISGIDGDVGVSISSVEPLYYLTAKGKPQVPASPVTEVSKVLEAWTKTCPDWENGYSYYTCSQITRTDGTVVFSEVVASGDIKNHIFRTAEDETPKPPYNYGDLWMCAHYKGIDVEAAIAQVEAGIAVVDDNETVVVDANEIEYTNEILTCINARATGEEFSINDWQPAGDYAKRSDYEYLKIALPETNAVIDGGLVLGTFIGVSDAEEGSTADGNVVAGLCGVKGWNEEFYDAEKGKLLMFAGADAASQSPVKYKSAKFQVWDSGLMCAKEGLLERMTTEGLTSKLTRNPFVTIVDSFEGVTEDMVYMPAGSFSSDVELDWSTLSSGRRMILIGGISASAPTGKYFFENGHKLSSLEVSQEAVELVGLGTDAEFFGWIVISRTLFQVSKNYGRQLNTVALGRISAEGTLLNSRVAYGKTGDIVVKHTGKGIYTITLPLEWFRSTNEIHISVTGYGNVSFEVAGDARDEYPIYANVNSIERTDTDYVITMKTCGNGVLNDGSFFFEIHNINQW